MCDKGKHITYTVTVVEGSAKMNTLWILFNIGLALAEKLDRTYLPPPGSIDSGGRPEEINIPFEFPSASLASSSEEPTNITELVIGIDRVGPNEIDEIFDDISTAKPQPQINNNDNIFNSITPSTLLDFKQTSPFPISSRFSTLKPVTVFESEIPSKSSIVENISSSTLSPTDGMQYPQNNNQYSSEAFYKNSKAYLPPHSGDNTYSTEFLSSSTLAPVYNGKISGHEYEQPDYNEARLNHNIQSNSFLSMNSNLIQNYPNNLKEDISAYKNQFPMISQHSYASTSEKSPIVDNNLYDNPTERIQAQRDRDAVIINYEQILTPDNDFSYNFDTSNGIHGDERGTAINGVRAKGSYSYLGDDGNMYHVSYTADENGFIPEGAHLPTPPPIPEAILKVIEQAAKEKEAGTYDDGSYDEEKYGYRNYQKAYPENDRFINGADLPSKEIDTNLKILGKYYNKEAQNGRENVGYQYISPENRFIDTKTQPFENQNPKENNLGKVTAKPFLTPYVTQNEGLLDSSEKFDYRYPENGDNQLPKNNIEEKERFINDNGPISSNVAYPNYNKALQGSNHLNPSGNEAYINGNNEEPLIDSNQFYISSTIAPMEILSRLGTTQNNGKNRYNSDDIQSLPHTVPSYSSTVDTETSRSPLASHSSENPQFKLNFDDSVSTPKSIYTSESTLPLGEGKFRIPNPSSTEGTVFKEGIQKATENIIGEGFPGPRQRQQYDPNTGYYY